MQIVPLDVHDAYAVDQYIRLRQSVFDTHWWDRFVPNWEVERLRLLHPGIGLHEIRELTWAGSSVVGGLHVELMTKENQHHANAELYVHPVHAESDLKRELLERIVELTAEHGRTQVSLLLHKPLNAEDQRANAEEEFLLSNGFEVALELRDREGSIDALDREEEDRLRGEAEKAAQNYEIISWTGKVPEEFLQPLVDLDRMAMTQVPLGSLDLEDVDMNVDRRRAIGERLQKMNLALCQTVARHSPSNQVVANTAMVVYPRPSDYAQQGITLVAPGHRGHRLGLLLKLANVKQVREFAPHVQRIHTENAWDNEHMNSINERMGLAAYQIGREYLLKGPLRRA